MTKLKQAKCPNCGANIEVDSSKDKVKCEFCGSTIEVEEAVEKYKIELSGKVEVEGLSGRKDKLRKAKQHIKFEEPDKTRKILQ